MDIIRRNDFILRVLIDAPATFLAFGGIPSANAAPPFAVMADEMGYFPVVDERTGQTVMVPAKAKHDDVDH